jgi:hypothetical protein
MIFFIWLMTSMAYAGAGGTSGSDKSSWIMVLLLLPVILGWMANRAIMKAFARRAAAAVVMQAASRDSAWTQDKLKYRAKQSFVELQDLWSTNDEQGSIALVHPDFQEGYLRELRNLAASNQRNVISNIKISNVDIVLAKDFADDDEDLFVALIEGSMDDAIYDNDGQLIRTLGNKDGNPNRLIQEYWTFKRSGDDWLLNEISKSHDAVTDEVSIDAQGLAEKHADGAALQKAVLSAQTSEKRKKSVQKLLAMGVGLSIAVFGYYLYFIIFSGMWSMVTGWF